MCSATTLEGKIREMAARSLFVHPVTTSPSPRIIASKPVLATSSAACFFGVPTLVSSISARSKKSVSVAPGIRLVTVTPESLRCARRRVYASRGRRAGSGKACGDGGVDDATDVAEMLIEKGTPPSPRPALARRADTGRPLVAA
jgi:hypothetical protein